MDSEEIGDRQTLIDFVEEKLNIKEEDPLIEEKRAIDKGYASTGRKNLLRYVFLVVDTTQTSTHVDFKPSRIGLTQIVLQMFLKNFFETNPLSVVSIAKIQMSQCITLQEFTSSTKLLEKAIEKLTVDEKDEFSLFECLKETFNVFAEAPPYASKEVLLIQSTPSTKDKGNIFEQIQKAVECKLTFNILSLNAKTFVFSQLTKKTQGRYDTALNEKDFENLLNSYCEPPLSSSQKTSKMLIQVGFPTKKYTGNSFLCACHMELKTKFYTCPQCKSKNCDVPSTCAGCQLNLILPLHITKSYQQNTKLKEFQLLEFVVESEKKTCSACFYEISGTKNYTQCKDCLNAFCLECDILIHKQKLPCPKCREQVSIH